MILDSATEIHKFDKSNVLGSIEALARQTEQAFQEINKIDFPEKFKSVENVVVCGMGGSALGGRVVSALLAFDGQVPIEVFTGYHIPGWVSKNSLVILSSYSGNTEETIASAHEALDRGANIFVLATDGKLAEIAKKENLPSYIFEPKENPSNQPRMGIGYSIVSILSLLGKCKILNFNENELDMVVKTIKKAENQFNLDVPSHQNHAKTLATNLRNKIPVIISSEHLFGASHVFKNQLNENSKTFSCIFDIPELNHHLLEGLKFPPEAKDVLYFIMLKSKLYSDRVLKRYEITHEVIEKNDYPVSVYELQSDKKLEQIFEIITFGSFINFYLAMLYNIDPAPIPWVDYFKEKMGR